jgi:GxxExxY protein
MAQIVDAKDSRRDLETYAIIGAAMMVHRQLGRGFLELVYQEALEVELETRGIPYGREVEIQIHYRGIPLPARYRADFICFGNVLVELKAASRLTGTDHSQIINYLVATRVAGDCC